MPSLLSSFLNYSFSSHSSLAISHINPPFVLSAFLMLIPLFLSCPNSLR